MNTITVRRVSSKDLNAVVPGIVRIFRDDEVVPWHRYDECLAWVARRVQRGFYSTLAYDCDIIAGFSEWIETYENGKKILYLGMMQVDCDMRGKGIGGAMLCDGERYAKSIGASCLRTSPEDDQAYAFYRKYGFTETDSIYCCTCPTVRDSAVTQRGSAATITLDAVNTHKFIFGLCQSSGRHMYEVANYNPDSSFEVKTTPIPSGYLQFRYRKGSKTALALYWSKEDASDKTVSAIQSLGYEEGFEKIEFYFNEKNVHLFTGQHAVRTSTQLEREIVYE